jgi:hypothetical protein
MKIKLAYTLSLVALTFVSCGKQQQKTAEEELLLKPVEKAVQTAPIAEKIAVREYVDTLGGSVYSMTIERRPDEALPVVADVIGTRFYDNVVTLVVARNGQPVYRHTFYKKDFLSYLTPDDLEYGTLAGMTYYEEQSTAQKLVFGSQVCMPGMDGGALLKLELLTASWSLKVMRDETADLEVDALTVEEGV